MTTSHSVFQGSASDCLHNNRAKHPKLKYNRDFKRHMGPTLRYLLLLDPSGGVKQAPGAAPLAQSSTVCLLLVIPTNLRSQHIGITDLHLSVLALSGIPLSAGLEGAAGMQRRCWPRGNHGTYSPHSQLVPPPPFVGQ